MPSMSIDDAPDDLSYEIKRYGDWNWDEAASISWRESGWEWDASNDTTSAQTPCGTVIGMRDGVEITAEHSVCYFQLNVCNYPSWGDKWWFNVKLNVGEAHSLWFQRGWWPWYFSAKAEGLI